MSGPPPYPPRSSHSPRPSSDADTQPPDARGGLRSMIWMLCAALAVLGGSAAIWLLSPAAQAEGVRPLFVVTPADAEDPLLSAAANEKAPSTTEKASQAHGVPAATGERDATDGPGATGGLSASASVDKRSAPPDSDSVKYPTFNGRPIRPVRTVRMLTTAYSPDARSCGASADGITASGYSVWTNGMRMVAADTDVLPFGTLVSIPGYNGGRPVPVLDRGGAIEGLELDLLYATHQRALQWGRKYVEVTIWEYVEHPDEPRP